MDEEGFGGLADVTMMVKVGINGFGRIGRALAERVSGFGMTLMAYDPYLDAETIARRAMAIVNRPAYVDLIESDVLDIAISPRVSTVGALLSRVRRGDVVAAHSLRRGVAEAIEAVARSAVKYHGVNHYFGNSPEAIRRGVEEYARLAQWHVDHLHIDTFVVQYEALLAHPREVTAELARFIGVENRRLIRRAAAEVGLRDHPPES